MGSRNSWQGEILRRVQAVGWATRTTTAGHYHITSGVTGQSTTMPGSGGKGRGSRNAEAWIKRNGIEEAERRQREYDARDRRRRLQADRDRTVARPTASREEEIMSVMAELDLTQREAASIIPRETPTPQPTPQPRESKMSARPKRGKTHVDEVIRVLGEANGKPVHVDTIASQVGITREQVQKSISSARSRNDTPIEVVVKGRSYRWGGAPTAVSDESGDEKVASRVPSTPTPPVAPVSAPPEVSAMYELVGITASGRLVLRDEAGGVGIYEKVD